MVLLLSILAPLKPTEIESRRLIRSKRILILSTSAWLTGLAESLEAASRCEVLCLSPNAVSSPEHLAALDPDMLLVERDVWHKIRLRFTPSLPVIEIDARRSELIVHLAYPLPRIDKEGLFRIIERILYEDLTAQSLRLFTEQNPREETS